MKRNEAVNYLLERARSYGYSEEEIEIFRYEVDERVYLLGDDCDIEDLDQVFEEVF